MARTWWGWWGLAGLLVVALALSVVVAGPALVEPDDAGPPLAPEDPGDTIFEGPDFAIESATVESTILEQLDDQRRLYGLTSLEWNETVASVARAHSRDMADRSYFEHDSPEGANPFDRFDAVADFCAVYGETIARTWVGQPVNTGDDEPVEYTTAEAVATAIVDGWMDSQDHADTILEVANDRGWDSAGVGVYFTDEGAVYATANFCHET